MEIEIISFGKIAEIIPHQKMEVVTAVDTDELKKILELSFPALKLTKYKLALNNNFVQENTKIANNDTIAIMPPFSGG